MIKNFYGQFQSRIKCPDCNYISITLDAFNMVSVPLPRYTKLEKMRVEGYILRYSTSERNISFRLSAPNSTSGQQLLEHLAYETNINPKSLRAFYISKAKVAGEFENLAYTSVEKLMDHTSHLFFIEMFNQNYLDIGNTVIRSLSPGFPH